MLYKSYFKPEHGKEPVIGVLITNLGSPDAPTKKALKPYLKEFLSDTRVIEPVPGRWWWWLALNGVILNVRPAKSAEAYKAVWNSEGQGPPLLSISQRQIAGIAEYVKVEWSTSRVEFALGMRYGNPSVATALQELQAKGCQKILVLPLYPQYAGATTASTIDAIMAEFKSWRWVPDIRTINQYYGFQGYIDSLVASIKDYQLKHGKPDLLVMSYHGIPQRYVDSGDPYISQCYATSQLVVDKLGLSKEDYRVTFQSRFGREPWVQPYTDGAMQDLPKQGVKNIQIICPGFSADCLETTEEIAAENREYFAEAGGEKFGYIRCLNDRKDHLQALAKLVLQNLQGWE